MLKNIKSSYFFQIVFSFLYEKQKLKIIKYNKNLQKNININIINYKYFKGNYIIFEPDSNRIGKEYKSYNDELVFEGEYLHGMKNGKGKEYDSGEIIFEGEYLNGIKNGKRI